MSVTVKKILEKYPTTLDIESMDEKILNHNIPGINLEDITRTEKYEENNKEIGYIFRTNNNYLVTITQDSVGETWKDEFDHIHTLHIDAYGNIINT